MADYFFTDGSGINGIIVALAHAFYESAIDRRTSGIAASNLLQPQGRWVFGGAVEPVEEDMALVTRQAAGLLLAHTLGLLEAVERPESGPRRLPRAGRRLAVRR